MENKINLFCGFCRSEGHKKILKSFLLVISKPTLVDNKNDKDIFSIGQICLLILPCE